MKNQILEDLKASMKAQDKVRLSVIRMVKSSIQMEELNKKRDLTDEEVIDVISKQIKTRKDSIAEFEKGNRGDLVDATKKEIDILMEYLPKQLSEEEIDDIISKVFDEIKPESSKDMGKVMKAVTPLVRGKADMGMVSNIIKNKLN